MGRFTTVAFVFACSLGAPSGLENFLALKRGDLRPRASSSEGRPIAQQLNDPNFTGTVTLKRRPRVHFLFLAVDKVCNLEIWMQFFEQADASLYRAYVHCKTPACERTVSGSALHTVPAVPNYYCTDLVSPMQQLLRYALDADPAGHPRDKFAFISDSTLPAKPFDLLYKELSIREDSDVCVFPSNEWADIQDGHGGRLVVPKVHQWLTLNRKHAEGARQLWNGGHFRTFMQRFGVNTKKWSAADNSYGDSRNFGCLDEFWYFAALFGTLSVTPGTKTIFQLDNFEGGSLNASEGEGWQGRCDTFVMWKLHVSGKNNVFQRLHESLDWPSKPHAGNYARPGWWDSMTPDGMRAIRASDFLFVRKFIDKPTLLQSSHAGETFAHAYSQLVLT